MDRRHSAEAYRHLLQARLRKRQEGQQRFYYDSYRHEESLFGSAYFAAFPPVYHYTYGDEDRWENERYSAGGSPKGRSKSNDSGQESSPGTATSDSTEGQGNGSPGKRDSPMGGGGSSPPPSSGYALKQGQAAGAGGGTLVAAAPHGHGHGQVKYIAGYGGVKFPPYTVSGPGQQTGLVVAAPVAYAPGGQGPGSGGGIRYATPIQGFYQVQQWHAQGHGRAPLTSVNNVPGAGNRMHGGDYNVRSGAHGQGSLLGAPPVVRMQAVYVPAGVARGPSEPPKGFTYGTLSGVSSSGAPFGLVGHGQRPRANKSGTPSTSNSDGDNTRSTSTTSGTGSASGSGSTSSTSLVLRSRSSDERAESEESKVSTDGKEVVARGATAPPESGALVPIPHHGAYPPNTLTALARRNPNQNMDEVLGIGRGWPYVTARGTIALRMNGHIMVEMTCDQAIRLVNYQNNILLTIDATGMSTALVHPNGRMHQHNARVEVVVYEQNGNHKYAKMWYKGVSFTSERSSLVYLVDEGGTRTTADRFSPQLHAPAFATSSVFLNGSIHSQENAFQECYNLLQDSYDYYKTKNGTDVWVINGVRISQTDDLVVTVSRDSRENGRVMKRKLKTSAGLGTAFLSTPLVHATASMGQNPHLFVRRGERRLHKDPTSLVVRNGGHSAGFDEKGRLKVF